MSTNTLPMAQRSEITVGMAIPNPETTGVSRTFRYAGKCDLIQQNPDGETWTLVDWKTVSDIDQFVSRKTLGYQADLYALALGQQTPPVVVTQVEYRLIQSPSIKLCGKDASPEAYENRCLEWILADGSRMLTHYIEMGAHRYLAAKFWLWDTAQRILECRRRGAYLTNEHACWTWNRACPYLPLCTMHAMGGDANALAAEQYEQKSSHPELDASDDRDLLTYSSASTFCLCEMKYYWRNERGLVKRSEDEAGESAWTGSAMHEGMDALAKTGDVAQARERITQWADENPALGEDAVKAKDQNVAKARAMCRAAALKWFGMEATVAA